MNLDTSLIFHLNPEKASDVYQKIGPNYVIVLIEPNLRAAIREATASPQPTPYTAASVRWSPTRFGTSSWDFWRSAAS